MSLVIEPLGCVILAVNGHTHEPMLALDPGTALICFAPAVLLKHGDNQTLATGGTDAWRYPPESKPNTAFLATDVFTVDWFHVGRASVS